MKEVTQKEIIYWIMVILLPLFWLPAAWFLKDIFNLQIVIAISAVIALLLSPGYSTIFAVILMTFAVKTTKHHQLLLMVSEFCAYYSLTLDRVFRLIPNNPFAYGRISHAFVLVTLLQEREDVESSTPIIEESIKAIEKDYGSDSPALIGWLANLAHCKEHVGNFDESIECVNRLMSLAEKYGDEVECSVATNIISLCMVYSKRGRIKEAEELGLKALTMLQQMDSESTAFEEGSNNVLVGVAMNNLACVYDDICQYDKSAELYKRALKVKSIANSPDHPSIGAAHCNISGSLVVQNDFSGAVEHGNKALEILAKSGKENGSIWAGTIENLGAAHHGLKEYDKAKEYLLEALALKNESFAANDPSLASVYRELGKVYRDTAEFEEAESMLTKSNKIYEESMGLEHPKVGETLAEIAKLYEITSQTERLAQVTDRIDKINQLHASQALQEEKESN